MFFVYLLNNPCATSFLLLTSLAMFIRKTKTSSSAKGNHYSYRLVETYRVASKVKQKNLLNLGAHFDLEREYWPDLCQCIQNRLSNQLDLA